MELMEPEKLREKLQDRRRDGRYGPVGSEVNPARIFEQEERQEREETGKREQKQTREQGQNGQRKGQKVPEREATPHGSRAEGSQDQDVFFMEEEGEDELEIQARMKNLMWTVSGDYKLDTKLDLKSFRESKYVSMYDAIKQGAFARFFDKDGFALYLVKKVYYGADEMPLMSLAQICVDAASYPKILPERPGVREVRQKAFEYLLDHRFEKLCANLPGKIKLAMMRGALNGDWNCEGRIRTPLEKVRALEGARDTMELIRTVDELYNTVVDPSFEGRHGGLGKILETSLEELREFDWKNYLEEEALENLLEQYVDQMEQQMTSFETLEEQREEQERRGKNRRVVVLDEEAVKKVFSYVEKNFGKSYLTEQEQKQINYRLCRGAHCDCTLYYTEGILANPVMVNAQYVNAKKQAQNNRRLFLNSQTVVKRNVEAMTDFLRRSLNRRTEPDAIPAYYGTIDPRKLWRVGRTDPGRLFYRNTKQNSSQFVVEILMDASGSQRDRQGQVALQAYIISEALSSVKIPHQIMSFCTFWDYTVMQRFRDYDDPRSKNKDVLQYTTSSNNRDGLAIRAAGDSLQKREEENRILIVLSDGRPNDVVVNRPGSRNPKPYFGEYGVQDTAWEVRTLRGNGIYVLGVFTGDERDLAAEKKIFGKDFAYIRDIRNFSRVVSGYLQRLLEQDLEE